MTFPKPFKKSRIDLDDKCRGRGARAILDTTTEVNPQGDMLQRFLVVNGELRRKNAEQIAGFAKQSAPEILWGGAVFHPFTNSAVEAAFADQRTYIYQGKEVDRQTHLGFDLARVVNSPVVAANRGKVLYAAPLGIYGNCIILDHGMGVQSLYGHLSTISVQTGQMVEKEQEMGKSGMTGLAGGARLDFALRGNGRMVNPAEWWDAPWIRDRILRKLPEASGSWSLRRIRSWIQCASHHSTGLTICPFTSIVKCRWSPPARPVMPLLPISCSFSTICPV